MKRLTINSFRNMLLAVLLVLCSPSALMAEELRDLVMIVKPKFHPKTRETFKQLAVYAKKSNNADLEQFFTAYSDEVGHGTGWIYVDTNGDNFIITNRHVANQAAVANVYFEKPDGTQKLYADCPIVYVDNVMDLAVLQFPGAQKIFKRGFELDTRVFPDGTDLFAVGFPGFGNIPLWQFSQGIVTNSNVRIDPNYEYLIQHSAEIDPGNSGGPLLIKSGTAPTGYKVIGVNTWTAINRKNANFSIPAKEVVHIIQKTKDALGIANNTKKKKEELIKSCKILAAEIGSSKPDEKIVNRYISYAFVGEAGWDSFSETLKVASDVVSWEKYFFEDPIETMRSSIYWQFWKGLELKGDLSSIQFEEINYADSQVFNNLKQIRTDFSITNKSGGEEKVEITWVLEYGRWQISYLELPKFKLVSGIIHTDSGTTGNAENTGDAGNKKGVLIGIRAGAGWASGAGGYYDLSVTTDDWTVTGFYVGGSCEWALSPIIWLETGLNIMGKGAGFENHNSNYYEYEESVIYAQIPGWVKLQLPLEVFSFYVGGGLGIDLALIKDGNTWLAEDILNKTPVPSTYWKDFSPFNISANIIMGMEFPLFNNTLLGFEYILDYHILSDWQAGMDSHYFTNVLGGYLKYGI